MEVQEESAAVENAGQKSQSVAYDRQPALHGRSTGKMQAVCSALSNSPVEFRGVFAVRHPPDSVPVTCTRLKKMQATACIKMGRLCTFLPNWQEIAF